MILSNGAHLAYCTNIHPGGTWAETLASLNRWTLAVKEQVGRAGPYAIGLRLSDQASRELADPACLLEFQRWLEKHHCYVFTINGFPFGQFHGTRVKEQVYLPDWTSPQRVDYTLRLFDLLAELLPKDVDGSISTLPGSFKEFIQTSEQERLIRDNIWKCAEYLAHLRERTDRKIDLALEPEPCCLLENSVETTQFFDRLREEHPQDPRLDEHLGVNYDTCHFAVEFEEPREALARFRQHGIRLSKIHISNALRLHSSPEALEQVRLLVEDIYFHQVIMRHADGSLSRFKDLDLALQSPFAHAVSPPAEWRIHFHVPLYTKPYGQFETTADHILKLLKLLAAEPPLCTQLEIETYTWSVLPESLKHRDVTDQIVQEYRWTLDHLAACRLA